MSLSELATRRKCFKCHESGRIASECLSKAVLTTTQCAIIDEEEKCIILLKRSGRFGG